MGGRGWWLLLLAGSACSASSAPQPAPLGQLGARASFDLECPPQWLALRNVDDHVKGVEGCGRRATYVEVCDVGAGACVWWLNNASPAPTVGLSPSSIAPASLPLGPGASSIVAAPPPASSPLRDRE